MSYLVLARKYRPQDFSSVSGQEHVTRTLANSIRRGKVAHAYLFSGPRGVGKTSVARIFSKALNCKGGAPAQPCLSCTNCVEIAQGTSISVREIDGASHNSVDNVRELIETFRSLPPPGSRYKIYIIDEVHMLSTAAFNALLKSLEEPPPNTVFILATTEAHKIPETVISRCQRHDFRALTIEEVVQDLERIAASEGMNVEPEVLRMVARLSEGSMRDAQSLLDRLHSFCNGAITAAESGKLLGVVERRVLSDLVSAVLSRDAASALEIVQRAFNAGTDPALFLREFTSHWREVFVAKHGGAQALKLIGLSAADEQELLLQIKDSSSPDVQDLFQIAREGADSALRSNYPAYAAEALVVRMASREPVSEIADIIAQLSGRAAGYGSSVGSVPAKQFNPAASAISKISTLQAAPKKTGEALGSTARIVEPALETQTVPEILDWKTFVAFASEKGSKVLSEHLMRLCPQEFGLGTLRAKGPEFTVVSLNSKEMKGKLQELLRQYSNAGEWMIALEKSDNGARMEPGSLRHSEESQKLTQARTTERAAAAHPNVVALQKVFPGSTIENIKVKE